jgi:hypothetical protein
MSELLLNIFRNLLFSMVSALGDEHAPTTTVVVTTEVDSCTVAPLNLLPVSALVPAVSGQHDFARSSGPEALLTVRCHVALMTVISNYYSFSALLRTPILA